MRRGVDTYEKRKKKLEFLRSLGAAIDDLLAEEAGEKLGYCLIVFPFGQEITPGDYVSNAMRSDMVKALRLSADSLEVGQDIPVTIGSA